MNGPCGGTDRNGQCEVDPKTPCAWYLIWQRMEKFGREEELLEVRPPKDWSSSHDGGVRRIVREDLKKPDVDDEPQR
jgi:hypothetical protein